MLTRLKVSGFKNLVDTDVRFGPFTCIAGANGVGKSNLFDAIQFLSALADKPLVEAAQSVRAGEGRPGDTDSLFHRVGDEIADTMSFEAEMIVPREGVSDLGQKVEASANLLRYKITIARSGDRARPLELVSEDLISIPSDSIEDSLLFPYSAAWKQSLIVEWGSEIRFISARAGTKDQIGSIKLYDGQKNTAVEHPVERLERSVLSTIGGVPVNTTALLAKREMQSWKLLQLEPPALREPDDFSSPKSLGVGGAHLPATLYRLATSRRRGPNGKPTMSPEQVYGQVALRLSELTQDVREVWVEADEKHNILTLMAKGRSGALHPARALSDGTLRFLALTVLELDPQAQGLLCIEEPENGLHPDRISAMLRLLQDIAVDTSESVEFENPLRQVIVNTHSPGIVAQVPDDSLLVAETRELRRDGKSLRGVSFSALSGTWRSRAGAPSVPRGDVLAYLNPFVADEFGQEERRVVDREDFRRLLSL